MSGYLRDVGRRPDRPARDPLGKAALFSDVRQPGTVVIQCGVVRGVDSHLLLDFALANLPFSVWLPPLPNLPFNRRMTCPVVQRVDLDPRPLEIGSELTARCSSAIEADTTVPVDDLTDEPGVVAGRTHDIDRVERGVGRDDREHAQPEIEHVLHLVVGHAARAAGSRKRSSARPTCRASSGRRNDRGAHAPGCPGSRRR